MKHRHDSDGFTMMETLIAVAMLAILMGVGFVAVMNYQRGMKQKELDEIAKEIFVAAQNHLSVADSQGILELRSVSDRVGETNERIIETDKKKYNYYFVSDGKYYSDNREIEIDDPGNPSVISDMLPRFSIDDTIRTGGSYVIEYDLESATVTNVFYSDGSNLSDVRFDPSDFQVLFVDPGYFGSAGGEARYRAPDFDDAVIGWYGGDEAKSLARATFNAPRVEIVNEEILEAKVSIPARYLRRMTDYKDADPRLVVRMRGKTSESEVALTADGGMSLATFLVRSTRETVNRVDYLSQKFVIDDITQKSTSFCGQYCSSLSNPNFIPGEDIEVSAEISSNKVLSNIAKSNTATNNSLFASVLIGGTDESDVALTNEVKNFRHLENLDKNISGFDPKALLRASDKDAINNPTVAVKQTADMQWSGNGSEGSNAFLDRIATKHGAKTDTARARDASSVQIFSSAGNELTKPGTYAPINPEYSFTYNGSTEAKNVSEDEKQPQSDQATEEESDAEDTKTYTFAVVPRVVSNVKIDVGSGDAGLFGCPDQLMAAQSLELRNFNVTTASGNAGALAGKLTDCKISAILVRDYTSSASTENTNSGQSGSNSAMQADVSTTPSKITGTTAAGGLVGTLAGSSDTENVLVENCAAATLVSSSAQDAATGGLIGAVSNNASIVGSYAGGHTNGSGVYDSTAFNVTASGANSVSGGLVGRVNTSGAGGNVTIESCYATASASGKSFAGGLVGNATNAAISNCYCTGLVDATATGAGAFAGTLTNVQLGKSDDTGTNYFLEMVNQDSNLVPVGGQDPSEIKESQLAAADKDLETYTAFSVFTEPAVPYDATLTKNYGGKYTYKTTNLLKSSPEVFEEKDQSLKKTIATTHYGDWPSLETLVVNEK